MYYFITTDKKVTRRPHKFNAEYLDGKLTLLDNPNEVCYIVYHMPDGYKYNLKRLAVISAINGFDRVQDLNKLEADVSPPKYYSLIPVDEFWPYVQQKDYIDVTDNPDILESDPSPITATMVSSPTTSSSTAATTSSSTSTSTTTDSDSSVLPDGTETPTPVIVPLPSQTPQTQPTTKIAGVPPGGLVDTLNDAGFPTPQLLSDGENPLYRFIPPATKNT